MIVYLLVLTHSFPFIIEIFFSSSYRRSSFFQLVFSDAVVIIKTFSAFVSFAAMIADVVLCVTIYSSVHKKVSSSEFTFIQRASSNSLHFSTDTINLSGSCFDFILEFQEFCFVLCLNGHIGNVILTI